MMISQFLGSTPTYLFSGD